MRNIRVSAFKARPVLRLIQGESYEEAIDILKFCERGAADVITKCLRSAAANAEHNEGIDPEELFVFSCFADEGPTLRRWRPRARGRATRIHKRTCHITIQLMRYTPEELAERAAQESTVSAAAAEARRRRVAASRGEDEAEASEGDESLEDADGLETADGLATSEERDISENSEEASGASLGGERENEAEPGGDDDVAKGEVAAEPEDDAEGEAAAELGDDAEGEAAAEPEDDAEREAAAEAAAEATGEAADDESSEEADDAVAADDAEEASSSGEKSKSKGS